MVNAIDIDLERARGVAASVVDPEIPVLTIADLGILRDVALDGDVVVVTITPTYSGCPAMRQIEDDIVATLDRHGFTARVQVRHHPAWTTAWMSDSARLSLNEFGIAPPTAPEAVHCPRCQADAPRTVSRFGSTACKALMVCRSCGEPFDYFKQY